MTALPYESGPDHPEIRDIAALAAQSNAEVVAFVRWLLAAYGIAEAWHAAESAERIEQAS